MRLRNRIIKAAFYTDGDLCRWERDKREFYRSLWACAEDSCCIEDDMFGVKLTAWPSPMDADMSVERFDVWRDQLVADGKAIRYTVAGRDYLYLPDMARHEQPRNPQRNDLPLPLWVTWIGNESDQRKGKYEHDFSLMPCTTHQTDGSTVPALPCPAPSRPVPSENARGGDDKDGNEPEPPTFANGLPPCFTSLTDRAGTPAATDIRQAFAAAFLNHSPADWGEFCSAVESGCLHGCDGNRKQAVWCYTHILGDPDDPGGYPGKLKLHASPAGFRASRMLLKSMREDRREAPERSKR